ncbi:FxsA family protein [Allohahella marinimesophila]|uniref:FxsA family protein n=1 Tax=Allohahella marinimesophila TaxID=1054972 RepID=A0ABP7NJJ1_9GAMM
MVCYLPSSNQFGPKLMSRLLFLIPVIAIIELIVLVKVGQVIGLGPTILIIIATGVTGAWLLRRQGPQIMAQVQMKAAAGEMPARELVEGLLMVVGGILLMTPGFVTDACGMFLILPPTRALLISSVSKRLAGAAVTRYSTFGGGQGPFGSSQGPFGDSQGPSSRNQGPFGAGGFGRRPDGNPFGSGPAANEDEAGPSSPDSGSGRVIEGEFTEIDKK